MSKFLIGYKAWAEQNYLLDTMSLADLFGAYFTYPTIQFNIVFVVLCLSVAVAFHESTTLLISTVVLAIFIFSLAEYVVHRFVLHSRMLYRFKITAAIWKRSHYDHHQDATNLEILFADLRASLAIILPIAIPIGYLIEGVAGAAMGAFWGVLLMSIYELCHCSQHLSYEPKNRYLRRLKKRHLSHHFHNETGNFGITSHFWDLVFKTNYESNSERPRSSTVRNLGYVGDETKRFPWVRELSTPESGTDR